MIIAIDGPAGSGKSTVARIVSKKLGFTYLDTGAMYRAITYQALADQIALNNERTLGQIATTHKLSFQQVKDGEPRVFIGDRDVTEGIRTPEVDASVSQVSAIPIVRKAMVEQQRAIARDQDIVAEGRDMGTVVFPNAEVKIFITATPEARAHRRYLQNIERQKIDPTTEVLSEEEILAALKARDSYDSNRDVAPLKCADDATVIDSSDMSIDDVVEAIVALYELAAKRG